MNWRRNRTAWCAACAYRPHSCPLRADQKLMVGRQPVSPECVLGRIQRYGAHQAHGGRPGAGDRQHRPSAGTDLRRSGEQRDARPAGRECRSAAHGESMMKRAAHSDRGQGRGVNDVEHGVVGPEQAWRYPGEQAIASGGRRVRGFDQLARPDDPYLASSRVPDGFPRAQCLAVIRVKAAISVLP